MTHTEKCNPVAERAAIRRQQWEAEQPGFWRKQRYDNLDLLLLIGGTASLMIGIFGLISLV